MTRLRCGKQPGGKSLSSFNRGQAHRIHQVNTLVPHETVHTARNAKRAYPRETTCRRGRGKSNLSPALPKLSIRRVTTQTIQHSRVAMPPTPSVCVLKLRVCIDTPVQFAHACPTTPSAHAFGAESMFARIPCVHLCSYISMYFSMCVLLYYTCMWCITIPSLECPQNMHTLQVVPSSVHNGRTKPHRRANVA